MALRKLAVGVAGTMLLATTASLLSTGTAMAAVQQTTNGHAVPAQAYLHNPDSTDWLGSYIVDGQQVWCVDYALKAPDTNEKYTDDNALLTKWGKPLDATTAADISYLLLRYGNTTSADDSAALAHLLHSWTAPPQPGDPDPYNPNKTYQQIAYNAGYHLGQLQKLWPGAAASVTKLEADAAANHGPWTTSMTAPTGQQLIGKADNWTINVLNAAGKGLANIPVTLTATDALFSGSTTSEVVNTPADGSPLKVAVTANGPTPKVVATLTSPAAIPKVRNPADPNMQKIVTSGGTTQLTSTANTTALSPPGGVTITKTDAKTNKPIAGVTFELTGPDKKSPALDLHGAPILGKDGTPLVLTTGADGTAKVANLQTPQQVCVIETAPPPGYDQAFNPASPPSDCTNVAAGQTVAVAIKNVPNKIPVAIPAGGPPPTMTAMSTVLNRPSPTALILFGGLLVVAAGFAGTVVVRRRRR